MVAPSPVVSFSVVKHMFARENLCSNNHRCKERLLVGHGSTTPDEPAEANLFSMKASQTSDSLLERWFLTPIYSTRYSHFTGLAFIADGGGVFVSATRPAPTKTVTLPGIIGS